MNTIIEITNEFKKKVSESVRLHEEGMDRYRVFTPFTFDDGDYYSIILKKNGKGWMLSDEGHTFMHLSYEMELSVLDKGKRLELLDSILSGFGITESDGSLEKYFKPEEAGHALNTYLQTLKKITDPNYLKHEY